MPISYLKRFRFRLRTVFILFVVFAALLTVPVNRARRTRLVIDEVHRLGGQVHFAHEETKTGPFTSYNTKASSPGPDWLRGLIGDEYFLSVSDINLKETEITDSDLERLSVHLAQLPKLRRINLWYTSVSDRGVECLKDLTNLESLGLSHTNVTDQGMKYVSGLSQLKNLSLGDTAVTDTGLKYISRLSHLVHFQVYPKITDEGLVELESCTHLRYLLLVGNEQLTDKGMVHLMRLIKLKELSIPASVSLEARQQLREAIPDAYID